MLVGEILFCENYNHNEKIYFFQTGNFSLLMILNSTIVYSFVCVCVCVCVSVCLSVYFARKFNQIQLSSISAQTP